MNSASFKLINIMRSSNETLHKLFMKKFRQLHYYYLNENTRVSFNNIIEKTIFKILSVNFRFMLKYSVHPGIKTNINHFQHLNTY